ncbi:MAG TPA: EAL domain-containing protein [Spirochaetota bacterium]
MGRELDLSLLRGICDDYAQQGLDVLRERVHILTNYDLVTGLPNRASFISRLGDALRRAKNESVTGAILAIDLDDFRKLTDTYGYLVGDELLFIAGEKLHSVLGDEITVARIVGDEFFLLVREISNVGDLTPVIRAILSVFNTTWKVFKHEFYVTASIGIAIFPDEGCEVLDILRNATTALYKAKEMGKNQYQFYEKGINEKLLHRYELENGLRHAIEKDEIRIHYQPQVNILTGALSGLEALIRWEHPRYGLVPPDDFIPIAEDTGLIIPIGNRVLEEICAQLVRWNAAGFSGFSVAANISAKQLQQKGFVSFVRDLLNHSGVDSSRLEFEITESSIVKSMSSAVYMLGQFRTMGINIAIDDFGIGYSSLSYLKNLPADRIKIDKSFVWEIGENEKTEAIIESIVVLAQRMRLEVVAEGVETAVQNEFLHRRGCGFVQGYLYGKPVTSDAIERNFLTK